MKSILTLQNITLTLGDTRLFSNFNMSLSQGEHKVIMGPSGCGKTSLLRLAAGLLKPDGGRVLRESQRVSVQFQEPGLLPWLTAAENVNVVLSDKRETLPLAMSFLQKVGLSEAADKYPSELSGGMAQRVALARALAYGGELYLLDEPFRGLDRDLKADMIALVKEHTANAALLLITHDGEVAEAFGGPHVDLS